MSYQDLIKRNRGYVAPELQEKLKNTRLLFAGCGLGSYHAHPIIGQQTSRGGATFYD